MFTVVVKQHNNNNNNDLALALTVAWSFGVQLVVLFSSIISVALFDILRSLGVTKHAKRWEGALIQLNMFKFEAMYF